MAYTYDEFTNMANQSGMMNRFSQRELAAAKNNPEFGMSMLGLLQDISGAKTEEQRLLATEAANQLRKNYGVYDEGSVAGGTGYGSAGDVLPANSGNGSFSYEGQDSYQQLLDSIVNQQPFSYDLQADPNWGSYKKAYMREGDRASANAMAQAAAASGGRASSYALTAAQQAGNYYAGQLADIVPTLEQNAYTRYLSDLNNRMNGLGALESDRAFDYQQYLDEIVQKQQAYENALASYNALGYATPEVAAILGIQAGSGSGTGGGAGSGGTGIGGSGYDNGGLDPEQVRQLQTILGVAADGKYGTKSMNAAGGLSAREAYEKFVLGNGESLYDDMLKDLNGGGASDQVDTSNFTVTNRNGSGWIAIGNGRMSWTELERAVNQGSVVEVIDPAKGTITYKYASATKEETKKETPGKAETGGTVGGKKKDNTYAALN